MSLASTGSFFNVVSFCFCKDQNQGPERETWFLSSTKWLPFYSLNNFHDSHLGLAFCAGYQSPNSKRLPKFFPTLILPQSATLPVLHYPDFYASFEGFKWKAELYTGCKSKVKMQRSLSPPESASQRPMQSS